MTGFWVPRLSDAAYRRLCQTQTIPSRRHSLAIVFACLAGAAMMAIPTGCGSTQPTQARQQQATSAFIIFDNRTNSTVRVTVEAGERSVEADSYRPLATGSPQPIGPGTTFAYRVPDAPRSPDAVASVHRIRVEALGTTWEPPTITWWEVVGPQPRRVDLTGSKRSVALRPSGGGRIVQVPAQQWLERSGEATAGAR